MILYCSERTPHVCKKNKFVIIFCGCAALFESYLFENCEESFLDDSAEIMGNKGRLFSSVIAMLKSG